MPQIGVPWSDRSVHRGNRRGPLLALVAAGLLVALTGGPALGSGEPSGERILGQSAIEPAYDDTTGNLTYLLTPIKSPFPTHTNWHSVAPLYLVIYPASSTVPASFNLNCEGVPGNCPDHDGFVAAVATGNVPALDPGEPGVYGTNPGAVPGHDHLVAIGGSGGDFNVAWEVIEVLFTNTTAANSHLTTDAAVEAAVLAGHAREVDLGFAFHCSVVPATTYWRGTPVS